VADYQIGKPIKLVACRIGYNCA